ncbi:hypothetical protein CF326_g1262 [Tilletia indica]|nr:hypothetical protein CF326_g1262 [Tilletia indica]
MAGKKRKVREQEVREEQVEESKRLRQDGSEDAEGEDDNLAEAGTGDDVEEREENDNDTNPLAPAILDKWLQRQKAACLKLLVGEKPVLPPQTHTSDPHKDRLIGLQEQYRFIRSTVAQTLIHGASNSMAVLGEIGSGKHSLFEATLDSVAEEIKLSKPSELKLPSKKRPIIEEERPPYYHVHLDGSLQPTDRLCLRSLALQLVEQGAFEGSAVLEVLGQDDEEGDDGDDVPDLVAMDDDEQDDEPDEMDDSDSASGESDNVLGPKVSTSGARPKNQKSQKESAIAEADRLQMQRAVFASITSATNLIISLLSTPVSNAGYNGPVLSKPLVVSLSNFQDIVIRQPQALLYCLLDAVQASSYAPGLLVVGFSTQLEVAEGMEKRVKSRFSHRIAHVYPLDNVPAPRTALMVKRKMASKKQKKKDGQTDQEGNVTADEMERPTVLDIVKNILMARISHNRADNVEERAAWEEFWSAAVDKLLNDATFRACLRELWDKSTDVRLLQRILRPVILGLQASDNPILDQAAFRKSFSEQRMSALESVIRSLRMPELTLLITAKHVQDRGRSSFNFEMCWDELRRWLGIQAEFEKSRSDQQNGQSADVGPSPYASQMRQVGQDRHKGSRQERTKAKLAFKRLLELEVFMPDAAFSTLNMASLAGGLGGLSAKGKGSFLRDELVPVRCQIEVGAVKALIKEIVEKSEGDVGADKRLWNWVEGVGL